MRLSIALTIFRKELLDTLRDKRTLLMMIGIPVLLYPGMLLVSMQAAIVHKAKLDTAVMRVALQSVEEGMLRDWLRDEEKLEIVETEHPEEALAAGDVEVVLKVEGPIMEVLEKDASLPVEILYDGAEFRSNRAQSRVRDALVHARDRLQKERLETAGLDKAYITPLQIKSTDAAPDEKTTGTMLGLLLPVMMIITIALGAFYPAVDLTAGEKERGTFESLLSTSATKLEIVTGKFVTVFLLAMVTGLLNLASMALSSFFLVGQLTELNANAGFSFTLPIHAVFVVLIVIAPLAFLISAIMMCSAIFARSFKEAQNYLTPVFMIIIAPAVVAGFPGVELTTFTQFAPIANVVLLFRDLMIGKAGLEAVFAVFFSSTLYALLALVFAAWLFQREEVVLSEESGIPLTFRRSDIDAGSALSPALALSWFSLQVVALFYLGSLVQQRHLIGGLLITEWGLILAPTLALLWFFRVDLKRGLNFLPCKWNHLLGAVFAGAGGFLLVIQVGFWQNSVLPAPEGLAEAMEKLFQYDGSRSGFLLLFFAISISPAICEEVLFRGAILTGLRQRLSPIAAILLVGCLFGLFHISIYRIVPTGLLGILLTYVAVRSGSIYPGILLHALINGTAVCIATGHFPGMPSEADLEHLETTGLPASWLMLGFAALALGIAFMEVPRLLKHDDQSISKVT
jgi:sodium transport system permease protein